MSNKYDMELLKQSLNTLLTYLDSIKNICDNIRVVLDKPQVAFNCVELKSTPCFTTDEIKEYLKTMKKFPSLTDIVEKRGEHNANSQRDTEQTEGVRDKGSE